jgi:hypothetical protein
MIDQHRHARGSGRSPSRGIENHRSSYSMSHAWGDRDRRSLGPRICGMAPLNPFDTLPLPAEDG